MVVELLEDMAAHLQQRRPPRLAVLVAKGARDWPRVLRTPYPSAHIVHLDVSSLNPRELHARLAADGRYDAIVVDGSLGAECLTVLQEVFLHLRPGGALFVELPPRASYEGDAGGVAGNAWDFVEAALGRASRELPASTREEKDRMALADAVSRLVAGTGHLVLTNRTRAVAKLREDEMDLVLRARGAKAGTVITRLPPEEFVSRCVLRENTEQRDLAMPECYPVPAMSLREYREVLCLPRQVAIQRNVVLPDTFRFNVAPRLTSYFLDDLAPRFAEMPDWRGKARRLDGTYFYLDDEWNPHFGHVLTEQMSRLWALSAARRTAPDMKVLLSRRRGQQGLRQYEKAVFGAAGLDERDFVLHRRPVRVERLLAASPMWCMPYHVHPGLADVWREIGDRIDASAPERQYPRRIFCSRRSSRRACHNINEVEALFMSHGFTIVYPEDMPFPEQVRMFREAEVVGGFAGSALFTAVFCTVPIRLIVLGPTSYPARNEYMICAVHGHEMDYVWSAPDPVAAHGPKPQYAGFHFDFEQEGAFLKGILSTL